MDINAALAQEMGLKREQVDRTVALIDEGNTIPFIARYRKEVTGSLDDQVLRQLDERLTQLRNLDKRREEIAKALENLGIGDPEVLKKLEKAATMTELEDIYRPFRPKRRTRASIAREKGLEGLADALLNADAFSAASPEEMAAAFLSEEKGVGDVQDALQGARDILAERISDDPDLRKVLRNLCRNRGVIAVRAAKDEDSVYSMYYDHRERVCAMPSHRVLAMDRGEKEGFLKVSLEPEEDRILQEIKSRWSHRGKTMEQLDMACEDAWERLLFPSLERDIRNELTENAGIQAVRVFADNLYPLLMQPPIRGKVTLGVDPGFRTGCKLCVVSENGRVLATGVGHFTIPGMTRGREEAARLIKGWVRQYNITAIAIGNGTASRESEQFIVSLLPELPGNVAYIIVSEAGASVYSASRLGAEEFPEYDVSLRSAVSIARRMQDPLAELVKIDPRSIGVGQYQHDVNQKALSEALDGVVERCVNSVGVEGSTASASLLSHVAGIGPALAQNIVRYREEKGLAGRAELKKVPKLGPKAFEQCAGFLRFRESDEPLDATAVHPESYAAARKLLKALKVNAEEVRGGIPDIRRRAAEYGTGRLAEETGLGLITLNDILSEMEKPGRDPRDDLPKPVLRTDVLDIADLKKGMELTGTVRNVVDFGAFVDIGVHQDGLVHISRMSRSYIKTPGQVVKTGDVVTVWVVDVDVKKQRISLSMIGPETGRNNGTEGEKT